VRDGLAVAEGQKVAGEEARSVGWDRVAHVRLETGSAGEADVERSGTVLNEAAAVEASRGGLAAVDVALADLGAGYRDDRIAKRTGRLVKARKWTRELGVGLGRGNLFLDGGALRRRGEGKEREGGGECEARQRSMHEHSLHKPRLLRLRRPRVKARGRWRVCRRSRESSSVIQG
jgi:hypothetical protein